MNVLAALMVALLLWAGVATPFAAWRISLGTLTAFVLLFRRFFAPITALGDEWQTVQSALAGLERIFQVLALPAEEAGRALACSRQGQKVAAIGLADVSFGYFIDRPVLQRVSLDVQFGEHVAVVGRTGAGKSSLLNLIGGLYHPWSGEIKIAGMAPGSIAEDERRCVVGIVPQTDHLFSGTLLDNLTLGDAKVTRAAVEQAASISGAAGFIRTLPQGYDTRVSDGARDGVQLSAGQRQLLSLTRALVWDPPVLLLDEATARIDSASEAAFRAGLRASRQPRRARGGPSPVHGVRSRSRRGHGSRSGDRSKARPTSWCTAAAASLHCSNWKPPAGTGGMTHLAESITGDYPMPKDYYIQPGRPRPGAERRNMVLALASASTCLRCQSRDRRGRNRRRGAHLRC